MLVNWFCFFLSVYIVKWYIQWEKSIVHLVCLPYYAYIYVICIILIITMCCLRRQLWMWGCLPPPAISDPNMLISKCPPRYLVLGWPWYLSYLGGKRIKQTQSKSIASWEQLASKPFPTDPTLVYLSCGIKILVVTDGNSQFSHRKLIHGGAALIWNSTMERKAPWELHLYLNFPTFYPGSSSSMMLPLFS